MTTTTLAPTTTAPAQSLAARINNEHRAMLSALEAAVSRAISCGELLHQAREREAKDHGQWLKWLDANCPDIPERSARRCMTIATGKEKIKKWFDEKSATLADLTLAEAERIARKSDQQSTDQTPQQTTDSVKDKPRSKPDKLKEYDKAEGKLIENLNNLSLDAARLKADRTIHAITDTLEDLEAKEEAKKKAA
jgi:hypothetical protein